MSNMDESLNCKICSTPFNLNDRLPLKLTVCGHVFCRPCLKKTLESLTTSETQFKCPTCAKFSKTDPNIKRNVNFFPEAKEVSVQVKERMEERELPACEAHKGLNKTLVCLDCDPSLQVLFCKECVPLKHGSCSPLLVQPRRTLDGFLRKALVNLNSDAMRGQLNQLVAGRLADLKSRLADLVESCTADFDQTYKTNADFGLAEFTSNRDKYVLLSNKGGVRVMRHIDPFLDFLADKFSSQFECFQDFMKSLKADMFKKLTEFSWFDAAMSQTHEVHGLKTLLEQCEDYKHIEGMLPFERLNQLRIQHSLKEKEKMKVQLTRTQSVSQGQPTLAPTPADAGTLSRSKSSSNPDVKLEQLRATLSNPLSLAPLSAKITQGLTNVLRLTIAQGEKISAKNATTFETDPSRSNPLLKGDRFEVIDNWILSRKVGMTFEGTRIRFKRKPGSTSETLHCLVNMTKLAQQSLFRIRLVKYDNKVCSHFGFCDAKEIECIKQNQMRFSSQHARCYVTNGYAPCILDSQQFLGVKWRETTEEFLDDDVIYVHYEPQKKIEFFLQRQNLTVTFERFDEHCNLRFFMTFVSKVNEYEFEQLL